MNTQPEIYTNDSLMKALKIMARKIRLPFSKIYYPCSSTDASVAEVFKLRKVAHIDKDRFAVDSLRRAGYEAHHDRALRYGNYHSFDLVVLMRSELYPNEIKKVLKKVLPGCYVFCGDENMEATTVSQTRNFETRGIIMPDPENNELYWEEKRLEFKPGLSNFYVFQYV